MFKYKICLNLEKNAFDAFDFYYAFQFGFFISLTMV